MQSLEYHSWKPSRAGRQAVLSRCSKKMHVEWKEEIMNKPVFHRVVSLAKNASVSGFPQNYGFIHLSVSPTLPGTESEGELKNGRQARDTCLCRYTWCQREGKYIYTTCTQEFQISENLSHIFRHIYRNRFQRNFFIRNGGLREWG